MLTDQAQAQTASLVLASSQSQVRSRPAAHRALCYGSTETECCYVTVVLICQSGGSSVAQDDFRQTHETLAFVSMVPALQHTAYSKPIYAEIGGAGTTIAAVQNWSAASVPSTLFSKQ